MQVIAIASQKGGVGKTTLTGHMAVEAERMKAGPVIMVDTDPQGSLRQWWGAREAEGPAFAEFAIANLSASLSSLRKQGYRLVLIDTPPATTPTIRAVIAVADLVVIPTRPSPHDLRAVGATVDMAQSERRPFVFVVNGAANRARVTTDAALALSQHGRVCPTIIYQRTEFATSMTDGRTVGEIDADSRSAAEISALWTYVSKQLSEGVRT